MAKVIKIKPYGVENGIGLRTSIFFSGCEFYCKNCFNSEAWDFKKGVPCGDWLLQEISKSMNDNVDGISILGGEPMHDRNIDDVLTLVANFKIKYPAKTIWIYSGYLYEELILSSIKMEILKHTDVLVDGRYVDNLKNIRLRFRGSSNQRIIDVKESLDKSEVVLWNKSL